MRARLLAASVDLTFDWATGNDGTNYGALAEVTGTTAYTALSGKTWSNETQPSPFDTSISAATTPYNTSKRSAEWEEKRHAKVRAMGSLLHQQQRPFIVS